DPTRTQWIDNKIRPDQNNKYFVRSFSLNEFTSIVLKTVQISTPSNIVYSKVELNAAQFRNMVIGCSLPFTWTDDQLPAGERVYYTIYLGNPATGGTIIGDFEGNDASVNLSPELYDLLNENTNQSYYIVKTVLYNNQAIQSAAVSLPNNFTVTETAFLFSEVDFRGDCVTVTKTSFAERPPNLNHSNYDFDNKLSSMLVRGDLVVHLYDELQTSGFNQSFFTDEEGFAYVRDFGDEIIGANTVSSLIIRDKVEAVYFFSGPDFTGTMNAQRNSTEWWNFELPHGSMKDNDISSVKVVGPYAVVLFDDNYTGTHALIKEDYGNGNLGNMDNKTSSFIVYAGEGVWMFDYTDYRG
ncbi:peptidase inhibitor family I36 protein, partial [Chengkuizengella marina]|uniref:peptidase inhibitor family I36 protein n=1 Tax=Chengkuizengella marina TaxID=2507566 RepID=UPI00136E1A54